MLSMTEDRSPAVQRAAEFRQRQAEALAELRQTVDPRMCAYLLARANQAGCEAAASERYVETGDWTR